MTPHQDGLPALQAALDRIQAAGDPARLGEADHIKFTRDAHLVQSWCTADGLRKLLAALPLPVQEAVHQFRKKHCSDWYDGHPDPSDGGGPYECRTLYAQPANDGERTSPYGHCTITGPAEDVAFIFRHLPDVDDQCAQPASPERKPLAWINRKVVYDSVTDKVTGFGKPEISRARMSMGYDWANAVPLYADEIPEWLIAATQEPRT